MPFSLILTIITWQVFICLKLYGEIRCQDSRTKWSLSLGSEGRFDGAFLFSSNFPDLSMFFSTDVMKSAQNNNIPVSEQR